jgi:hypothetical protein
MTPYHEQASVDPTCIVAGKRAHHKQNLAERASRLLVNPRRRLQARAVRIRRAINQLSALVAGRLALTLKGALIKFPWNFALRAVVGPIAAVESTLVGS